MTCGVAVSASNYGTPLFNLLQSRSNYRSSRESLGVAFRERARTFPRITIHARFLRDQLSPTIVHHFHDSRFSLSRTKNISRDDNLFKNLRYVIFYTCCKHLIVKVWLTRNLFCPVSSKDEEVKKFRSTTLV